MERPQDTNDSAAFLPGLEAPDTHDAVPATPAAGQPAAAPRLRRPDRMQHRLTPTCADELVDQDHPVRTIWAVVESLDLSGFYKDIQARGSTPGRAMTDPRVLVGLWLYAATVGIGSARELERGCDGQDAFKWLCGGLSVNHHTLSDFRVGHGKALDALFTQVLASLADKKLVTVERISQDGTRVRAFAGIKTFRRKERLQQLLEEAKAHVELLKAQVDGPIAAALSARQKAAQDRAARERQERIQAAIAQIPRIQEASQNSHNTKAVREREARASTTDPDARRMRMGDGGSRPAFNVQLAVDTQSRAVVGVEVVTAGSDNAQNTPMREQVQERTGLKVKEHLADGGFISFPQIEQAHQDKVAMYIPPRTAGGKPPKTSDPNDTEAIRQWRDRMNDPQTKEIYKERASTVETVNADLKCYRGLGQFTVRGLPKVTCVVLWSVLAYNILHFAGALAA